MRRRGATLSFLPYSSCTLITPQARQNAGRGEMAEETSLSAVEEELASLYPGRDTQIGLLHDLLGKAGQPCPPLLHIYDANTPASSLSLLQRLLVAPSIYVIDIDPLVCSTPRSLFHRIWTTLSKFLIAPIPPTVDDSIDVFLGALTSWMEVLMQMDGKLILLISRAERMRDVWPESITGGLYNIAERVNAKGYLSLITISCLPDSHFRTTQGTGLTDTIVIAFPRLAKEDAVLSLSIDANRLIQSDNRHNTPFSNLAKVHTAFSEVAYDSFASEIRDMDEIRLLACCVWYPFIEPLIQGVVPASKAMSLIIRGSYLFRDALSRLHTREIAPAEWMRQMVQQVKSECDAEASQAEAEQRLLPPSKALLLPLIPSFLLLASFLASYNPARLDVRYFARDETSLLPEAGGRNGHSSKKRKRGNRRGGNEGNRQEMLGPKMFTLDRLLSIFQALMVEAGPEIEVWVGEEESQVKSDWWEIKSKSVGVMEAVNGLIRLNTLVRTSASEKLESTTMFRTNITFETASQVSKRASFNLEEWLWDWK